MVDARETNLGEGGEDQQGTHVDVPEAEDLEEEDLNPYVQFSAWQEACRYGQSTLGQKWLDSGHVHTWMDNLIRAHKKGASPEYNPKKPKNIWPRCRASVLGYSSMCADNPADSLYDIKPPRCRGLNGKPVVRRYNCFPGGEIVLALPVVPDLKLPWHLDCAYLVPENCMRENFNARSLFMSPEVRRRVRERVGNFVERMEERADEQEDPLRAIYLFAVQDHDKTIASRTGPRRGLVEVQEGAIRVVPGRRRPDHVLEEDVSRLFFKRFMERAFDSDYPDHTFSVLSPSFYKYWVFPHVRDLSAGDPFDWAFSRAQIAMAAAVAIANDMRAKLEMPVSFIPHVLEDVAPIAVNVCPPELKNPRTYPESEKFAELRKALEVFAGADFHAELICLAGESAELLEAEWFEDREVRSLVGRMDQWLDNGLVIFRLTALIRESVPKDEAGTSSEETRKRAFVRVLHVADNIYGATEKPWYFKENFYFTDPLRGEGKLRTKPFLSTMDKAKALEVMELVSKEAGYDFCYVLELYGRVARGVEACFDQERAVQICVAVCRAVGIGNIPRAVRTINFLLGSLEGVPKAAHEGFVNLFLSHLENTRETDYIVGALRPGDTSVEFPHFDSAVAAFANVLPEKNLVPGRNYSDEFSIPLEWFGLVGESVALPLSVRAQLAPAYSEHYADRIAGRHLLLGDHRPTAHLRLLAEHHRTLLLESGQSGTALELARKKTAVEGFLRLYQMVREEVGELDRKAISYYCLHFMPKMPDPFAPPKGLFLAISTVVNLKDDAFPIAGLFHQDCRDDDEKEELADHLPKSLTRSASLTVVVDYWLAGVVSLEGLQRVFAFIAGTDVVVTPSHSLEEFMARRLTIRDHFANEDEPEASVRASIESDYARRIEKRKKRIIVSRVDLLVMAVTANREAQLILEVLGVFGQTLSAKFFEGYLTQMLERPDPEKLLDLSEKSDMGEHDHNVGKAVADWLDPYKLVPKDEAGFAQFFHELVERGGFNADEFLNKIVAAGSVTAAVGLCLQLYSELRQMFKVVTITDDLRESARKSVGEDEEDDRFPELLRIADAFARIEQLIGADKIDGDTVVGGVLDLDNAYVKRIYAAFEHLHEAMQILTAIRQINGIIDEHLPELSGIAGGKAGKPLDAIARTVRDSTRMVVGVLAGVATVLHMQQADMLRRSLGQGAAPILIPERTQRVLSVREISQGPTDRRLGFPPPGTRSREKGPSARQLVETFRGNIGQVKEWLETVRGESLGMMPVGGKIHLIHPITEKAFRNIRKLLSLGSTNFRLIHAGRSLILPPVLTAKEFFVVVFCLQQLGFVDLNCPEIQIDGPYRLDNCDTGILTSSVMLSTKLSRPYDPSHFVTTTNPPGGKESKPSDPSNPTKTRVATYDKGVCNEYFPGMGIPGTDKRLTGRTGKLGCWTAEDVFNFNPVHTLLVHAQFPGMLFTDIGRWYRPAYTDILVRHNLADILDVPWAFDPDRTTEPPEAEQQAHFNAVSRCADAYFGTAAGKNEIVYEVRDLIEEAQGRMRERQAGIIENPGNYPDVDWEMLYKEYGLAVQL